jgi:hypothetical protein
MLPYHYQVTNSGSLGASQIEYQSHQLATCQSLFPAITIANLKDYVNKVC